MSCSPSSFASQHEFAVSEAFMLVFWVEQRAWLMIAASRDVLRIRFSLMWADGVLGLRKGIPLGDLLRSTGLGWSA